MHTQTAANTVLEPVSHAGNRVNGNGYHKSHGPGPHNRLTYPHAPAPSAPSPSEIRDPVSGIEPSPQSDACATLPPESVAPPPDVPPEKLSLLLRFFLDGTLSVLDVCEHCDVSVPELYAWAQTPDAQMRFEMLRRLSKLRDELIQLDATPQLRQALFHLAVLASAEESVSSRESRRKAAMALLYGPSRVPRSSGAPLPARSPSPGNTEPPPPADRPPLTPDPGRSCRAAPRPVSPCTSTPMRSDETPPPPRPSSPHPNPAPPP